MKTKIKVVGSAVSVLLCLCVAVPVRAQQNGRGSGGAGISTAAKDPGVRAVHSRCRPAVNQPYQRAVAIFSGWAKPVPSK